MPKLFNAKIPQVVGLEDGSLVVASRLTTGTPARVLVKQADVDAISYRVVVEKTGSEVIAATSVTIADVIFDTALPWDVDSIGYNFLHTQPAASFPDANVKYRVEYKVTLDNGHVGWIAFDNKTKKIFTS